MRNTYILPEKASNININNTFQIEEESISKNTNTFPPDLHLQPSGYAALLLPTG